MDFLLKFLLSAFGFASPEPVQGDRVILRPPMQKDYTEWSALRRESRDFLEQWEPEWTRDELSLQRYKRRLNKYAMEMKAERGLPFFLFSSEDGALLGGLNLSNIRRGAAQCCTLGYWMGEKFAGQGLMREAIELILPIAFGEKKLHRIEAACMPSNCRSINLLNSLKFRKEGYAVGYLEINGKWEDHLLYALTIDDWNSNSK